MAPSPLILFLLVALLGGSCSRLTCEPPIVEPPAPPPGVLKIDNAITLQAWCSILQDRPWTAICYTFDALGVKHTWLAESTSLEPQEGSKP